MTKNKRKDPSPLVRDEVLREAGYKCGNPVCRNILTLQLHHMVWAKDGGGREAHNLLALCGHCHDMHTHGHIPETAIRHWKGILVALNHAFNKESADLLLYLAKENIPQIWYSGDGLLRFAGLLAAGLVELAGIQSSTGSRMGNGPTSAARVCLSEKGRLIVDSWRAGDEKAFLKALNHGRSEANS